MNDEIGDFAERGMTPAQPVEAIALIAVSDADLWAVIREPGCLTNVHPFCETNDVERWTGLGGRDHVHYYSGIHYQRDVLDWREGTGYDLAVGPPSGSTSIARWWIEPTTPDSCRLGIEVTSFLRNDVSPEARARYQETMIARAIPPYLDAVVRGVAHYAETGVAVDRNQFGAHEIYSPAEP